MMTEVDATISYLEMTAAPNTPAPKLDFLVHSPLPQAYFRAIYTEVGRTHHWNDLLNDAPEEFATYCADPNKTMYTLLHNQAPAGFFVLNKAGDTTDLAYFGLLSDVIGQGYGGRMLDYALHLAWATPETKKVTVNTCTLDHPAALTLYQSRGFVITHTQERTKSI